MTSHEAREIIIDRKECFKREIERRYGLSDCGCDRNCKKCDLLHTAEDIRDAFDLAIEGLESPIWLKATDDPIRVATKLIEGIYVDEYDNARAYQMFSVSDLRQIAKHLFVFCEEYDDSKSNNRQLNANGSSQAG